MRRFDAGKAAAMITAAVLTGCAVGPNYHRPETPVDTAFANAGEPGLAAGDPIERYWTGRRPPRTCGRRGQRGDWRGSISSRP
jgi:outer membrane protein TolC